MPTIRIPGGFITVGAPALTISVRGKKHLFEMHSHLGPMLVDKHGGGLKHEPKHVMEAISLWAQQGKRMEGDLCRWDHEAITS